MRREAKQGDAVKVARDKADAKKRKAAAAKRRRAAKKREKEAEASDDAKAAPASTSTEDAKPKSGLVLLSVHNDERYAHWREPDSRKPVPNGIACPRCGNELLDKQPGLLVPGVPPRVDVRCEQDDCDWHGVRLG